MFQSTIEDLPDWLRLAPRFCADPGAAARALRPLIEAHADQGARDGLVPEPVIRGLAGSGLWGAMIPRDLGGTETTPEMLIDVVEQLAYADGSTAWIYMASLFAIANAAVWLGPDAVDAIFNREAGYLCAGQISKLGRAERVAGGWRISGQFQFGSGALWSSWLLGAFTVEKDGQPAGSVDGWPAVIVAFAPRRKARFHGNWDVMGLEATASVDFEILDQVIADDFVINAPGRVRRGGPLFEIGVSLGHVSTSLGIAMRALDEVRDLALRKRRFARATLVDQPLFQRDYGTAWAELEAARAGVRTVFAEWYAAAQHGKPALEVRARARAMSCWGTDVAAKVTGFAYRAAGSDALRNHGGSNRLQRCFRDVHASTQHRHIDSSVLLESVQAMFGIAPPGLDL
jgi:alkylation response protein AidB-like acyl-CoA dehydrogenase